MDDPESRNPWTRERLDDNFERLRDDVSGLETQIRAIAPVVPEVAALKENARTLARDVDKVERAVQQYVNRSVTKQLVIVSTPLFLGALGLLITLFAGKLG